MEREESGLTRRDLLRQSVSTVAAASAVSYGIGGATAPAAGAPTDHDRTIAALVDVVGSDPLINRSAEARAAVTRDLVALLEESTGPERQGLQAMFGAVERTVEGRRFADAEPRARRDGLRRAVSSHPEERDLVVRSLDAVVAAFQTLNDPTAGRYFGMYPLPRFITGH